MNVPQGGFNGDFYGIVWDCNGLYGLLLDYLGLYGIIWLYPLVNVYITIEKHNSSWLNPLMSCYHWLIDTLALYKFTIPKNGECIHVAVGI